VADTSFKQLYVGDYLSKTLHLTTEQHGAYLLLLMTMWRAGAKLPNDPAKLARIARVTPKRWAAIWAEISEFFIIEDGHISNDRLTKEHKKAVSISQERKTAGRKGGEAKALKNKEHGVANATVLPMVLPKHSQISESYRDKRETNVSPESALANEAFEAFSQAAERKGWPEPKSLSKIRRSSILHRVSEAGGIDGWVSAIAKAEASDFINGGGNWFCLDWLIAPKNFTKLMEGNYDNRSSRGAPASSALYEIAAAARAR